MNKYFKIIILVLIFGLSSYTWLVTKIWTLISDVNNYVVVFVPEELLRVFALLSIWIAFRFYQAITS